MNIEIIQVDNLEEIKNIIIQFDKIFFPTLSSRIDDLKNYSKKLYDNAITIKAVSNNEILGFASFYCNDMNNHIAYLSQIAVKQEARGRGIGQMLLDEVIKTCITNGMRELNLEVYIENINAMNLYKKNGFEKLRCATEASIYMNKKI